MPERMVPLFARVLVKREVARKVGSIHLPDEAAKRHARLRCSVVAVGPNCDKSIKVGDSVIIGRYAGDWVNMEGKPITETDEAEFFICADEDIVCRIEVY